MILILIGCCCLIAAAALGVYNHWEANRAASSSDELVTNLAAILENAEPVQTREPDENLQQLEEEEEDEEFLTVMVDGHEICGVLSIPDLEIELAIIYEWSYPSLNVSACRYSGTPQTQMILLAHNYDRHFGGLSELEPKDEVIFTDISGKEHRYQVTGTETWATNQLDEIISGESWDLTLFTCTYGGASRVVVRCEKVS